MICCFERAAKAGVGNSAGKNAEQAYTGIYIFLHVVLQYIPASI